MTDRLIPSRERLMTAEEVAPLFGVLPKTVNVWARKKRITGIKVGRRWLFKTSIVQDCIDNWEGKQHSD